MCSEKLDGGRGGRYGIDEFSDAEIGSYTSPSCSVTAAS